MELDKNTYSMNGRKRNKIKSYLKIYHSLTDQEDMNILKFVSMLKTRIEIGFDAWVGVSGETGTGKSQFVLMATALMGRRFNLKSNVAYIPKGNEITNKFDKLNGGELLIDEAGKTMRGVNWHNKDAQNVNVKAMTDRFLGNTVWLNMPDYSEFMGSTKKQFHFRIHLLYRDNTGAMVVIHRKIGYGLTKEIWGESVSEKNFKDFTIRQRMSKIPNNYEKLRLHTRLPTYVMHFKIPALQWILPDYVQAYETFKRESRKQQDEEDDKPLSKRQEKYMNVIEKAIQNEIKAGTSTKDLATKFGIELKTMYRWVSKAKKKMQEQAVVS